MAKRTTTAAQGIDDVLTENPKIATMTLARMLFNKWPNLWPSLEACRSAIRLIRGAYGKRQRAKITIKTAERTQGESEACRRWGSLLPDPEQTEWKWHDLREDVKRWLIIADTHVPYHDKRALARCLEHAEGNCDGVLILGDGPDAYQLSYWERDPRRRRFQEELDAWCQVLDALQKIAKVIVWKAGNHEYRLERYLLAKAPEFFGMDSFTWPSFCSLEQRGVEWVPAMNPIRYRHLTLLHGHEWGNRFSSPVNPARGAFLKAHDCTLEAHQHRSSHHVEHTLRERPISCWSIGSLCNLHPEFRPLGHKWNHGFAYLTTGPDWQGENHRIIEGEVVY